MMAPLRLRPERLGLFIVLLTVAVVWPVRATSLIADLSEHLVAITTGFVGADVLLFGAVDGPGDIVVVVRGPEISQVVLRKSRVGGIWMNTARMTFQRVPSFYAVASSRPLADIASDSVLRSHEMGIDRLRLELPPARMAGPMAEEWRRALIRNKQRQDLYVRETGRITLLGNRLFRTSVHLPANVPVGLYRAEIFLLREGQIVAAQTTPLAVSKVGMEAEIFSFAHERPALYGMIAVVLALVAGWLAHLAFRRG